MLKLRANKAISRFASVILSVLLLCAFVPFSTMAASADEDVTVVTTPAEFTAALSSSNSIKLGANISVGGSTYVNHDLTIDFDGHTLTFTSANAYGFFVYNNAKLTLVGNGRINSYYCAIYAGSSSNSGYIDLGCDNSRIVIQTTNDIIAYLNQDSKMTVGKNVTMYQRSGKAGIALFQNADLDLSGEIRATNNFAISTNGNATADSTVIIRDGAVVQTSADNVAIYQASGTYILEGGTITGGTGLYMRSGNLTVPADSTVTVKGIYDAGAAGSTSGGAYTTGDALVIDNSDYPAGPPAVSIAGGTFDSVNALSVSSIASASGMTPVSRFISGGRFNKEPQGSYLVIGVHTV